MGITVAQLQAAAMAVQAVEAMAASVATAPTGAQKLQAAVAIATTLKPEWAGYVAPLEQIIGSFVSVFHGWGVFAKAPAPTTVIPAATMVVNGTTVLNG